MHCSKLLLDHIVGAGECRHRGGTCARPAISSTSCPRAIGVAGSEFVLDLGLRGSAQLGPRWFTKTLLVEIEAKLFKHSDRCTCYGSFDRSEDAIVRTAFCPVAHAYDWQRLEHHLASIRLGKNSAPQLRQISIRLVAGFRRGLGSTIGCSSGMRRISFETNRQLSMPTIVRLSRAKLQRPARSRRRTEECLALRK